MKKTIHILLTLCVMASCEKQVTPDTPDPAVPGDSAIHVEDTTHFVSSRTEQYRPQIHYSPKKYWVNDPNGLVYRDGIWHMFYQYNPSGNSWGNMSWGHATSTDMVHWTEQSLALVQDNLGAIFSGSAVVDRDNTAGFGENAIVAMFTSAGNTQQQSLAYSTDGLSFRKYSGNPVIPSSRSDFRDPKVLWDTIRGQWVATMATGWGYTVEFWGSKDLKSWKQLSTFSRSGSSLVNAGQWECPELICVDGQYYLILSVNPGGPIYGSGTMYFPGTWDGTTFVAEEGRKYPLWLDYGTDNYAGVTWNNAPEGRTIYMGWMNNWKYSGDVPCHPWRSAFTLPRELHKGELDGKVILTQQPIQELDAIATEWKQGATSDTLARVGYPAAWEAIVRFGRDEDNTIRLANSQGEYFDIEWESSRSRLNIYRTATTGATSFQSAFAVNYSVNLSRSYSDIELHIFIDQASVEIFTADGAVAITSLVYPSEIYHYLTASSAVEMSKSRTFHSIWL